MKKEEIPEWPRPLPENGELYFVGVGGAGQSAIAYVLAERGRKVSGSDPGISLATKNRLESVGVTVYPTHDASQVGQAVALIVSDAIPEANPEVQLAQERDIPIYRRPEALASLVNAGRGIAIAGTHGKTTTTGMVASILLAADLDPTVLIGGDLPAIGGNARSGLGEFIVAESCEAYDGFLYLHPEIAVITNIEADHLDYHGSEEAVFASFERFAGQVEDAGVILFCGDDDGASELAGNQAFALDRTRFSVEQRMFIAYGIDDETNIVSATDINLAPADNPGGVSFRLLLSGQDYGMIRLKSPGLHNIRNALAAAGVAWLLEISREAICAGLEGFGGTGRRFERIGEVNGVLIVDDYAHHPTEIRATLEAARAAYPDCRLVVVFQPHLPSRTRDFLTEFADSLSDGADVIYLTAIYLAREKPIDGVSSESIKELIQRRKPSVPVRYVANKADLPEALLQDIRPGDLVLTMGAGDIRAVSEALLFELKRNADSLQG